jgi:2,3-bisphosphoglycerate-independent phosphoglycerate mutase
MIRPLVLVILDGWGVAPPWGGNAITIAKTPYMNLFSTKFPATTLKASGEAVGLPEAESGNSEVGHLTIGAGAIVHQDYTLITKSINDKSFFENPALVGACETAVKNKSTLHLMGLLSEAVVHSHFEHLIALLSLAIKKRVPKVAIHVFTDGRDSSPYGGLVLINKLSEEINRLHSPAKIATVIGRFYALDRDRRWTRTQAAYDAMVHGVGKTSRNPVQAISQAYREGLTDEFVPPTVITDKNKPVGMVSSKDAIIFFNFRADRARQLTQAFVLPVFSGFARGKEITPLYFTTMTNFEKGLATRVAFYSETVKRPIAEVISSGKLTQMHIAETEKYAHVTYFLNGQKETPFPGEARILVPSPKVSTYDQVPEMSAPEITEKAIATLRGRRYDFYVINYANPDMVGHTGNLKATIRAVEVVDEMLGKLWKAVEKNGGAMIVTSDHGNAEQLIDQTSGEMDTAHNPNPVPFIVVGEKLPGMSLQSGELADVAPTVLSLLDLSKPTEMTGRNLFGG